MNARVPSALALAVLLAVTPARTQGLPDLGDASAAALSETQERVIGNRIMREVVVDPQYVDDPEISDYINAIGSRLLGGVEGPRRNITFFMLQDDSINAFALVGGHIGVHTGLLMLTQNESELAGVMGHEIGHIVQRHQARAIAGQSRTAWSSLAALALAVLASRSASSSQSGQITEAALATASALQMQNMLDYTREHEREADRVGLTIMDRAGFDTRAMATFFERLLRANRLNEFKGAPSYLRTHPLTTERIAEIQDRIEGTPTRMVPDSLEYRLTKAKVRAMAASPSEAVTLFRNRLAERTIVRPREEVYGLAFALRRAREFDEAWKTLAPLREGQPLQPAFELLAGQILAESGKTTEALAVYRNVLKAYPRTRGLVYAYLNLMLQMGNAREVVADLDERLRGTQDDSTLYEIQARAFAALNRQVAQHRAQAESYYRRGNLSAAVDQLEIAVKTRTNDFYEASSAESRLREMRALLENERAAEKALKISS